MTKIHPEVAAHVLAHFEQPGGTPGGRFVEDLISAVDMLGGVEVLRMVAEYVAAVQDAASKPGVERLQVIVGGEKLAEALA